MTWSKKERLDLSFHAVTRRCCHLFFMSSCPIESGLGSWASWPACGWRHGPPGRTWTPSSPPSSGQFSDEQRYEPRTRRLRRTLWRGAIYARDAPLARGDPDSARARCLRRGRAQVGLPKLWAVHLSREGHFASRGLYRVLPAPHPATPAAWTSAPCHEAPGAARTRRNA